MRYTINSIKLLSPSPTNFIIQVEQMHNDITNIVNYVGSGEYCFNPEVLKNNKISHSTVYKNDNEQISAYALFDVNDLLIGISAKIDKQDTEHINYILSPAIEKSSEKLNRPIYGFTNNKNVFIGSAINERLINATPSRKYTVPSDLYYNYISNADALVSYDKKNNANNVHDILRISNETIIQDEKVIEQIFAIPTFKAFSTDGGELNARQNISTWALLVNDFDNSVLSAASFITPKQTLNSEYSTEKTMLNKDTPFTHMREYNNTKLNMYASGNLMVFNYIETLKLVVDGNEYSPTQITSNYSKQIGLGAGVTAFGKNMYGNIADAESNLDESIYQHYLPEIINVIDDSFSGTGGGEHGSKRAIHKANIFDIDISLPLNRTGKTIDGLLNTMSTKIQNKYSEISTIADDITQNFTTNIKKHINTRLQEMVSEIIPAHTHLFRVVTTEEL